MRQRKDDKAWIIHDGKKRIRTGNGDGQLEQAEAVLQEYLVSKASNSHTLSLPQDITIGKILASYLDDAGPEKNVVRQMYAIKRLAPFWANRMVSEIKGATCREYRTSRAVAASTVRRELGVLQAAINHAHREGHITHPVKVFLPKAAKPKERYLTRSEIAKLLRASPKHLRRFILISVLHRTAKMCCSRFEVEAKQQD